MSPTDWEDDPDAPPTDLERAAAARLARELDAHLLAHGAPLKAVSDAAGAAIALRAAAGQAVLDPARQVQIIDEAFAQTAGQVGRHAPLAPHRAPRWGRRMVVATTIACAAATLLWWRTRPTPAPVNAAWQLGPTDAIVGEIAPAAAGASAARLEQIAAARHTAYMDKLLAGAL